ncbi:hypothetical protein LEP1GSC165_0313 [Leptospira santarosai str. CBC523]|nr:hypothetical protein LEP1GSC165_0313 [Leptospira santarosai str. CBC523]
MHVPKPQKKSVLSFDSFAETVRVPTNYVSLGFRAFCMRFFVVQLL